MVRPLTGVKGQSVDVFQQNFLFHLGGGCVEAVARRKRKVKGGRKMVGRKMVGRRRLRKEVGRKGKKKKKKGKKAKKVDKMETKRERKSKSKVKLNFNRNISSSSKWPTLTFSYRASVHWPL